MRTADLRHDGDLFGSLGSARGVYLYDKAGIGREKPNQQIYPSLSYGDVKELADFKINLINVRFLSGDLSLGGIARRQRLNPLRGLSPGSR